MRKIKLFLCVVILIFITCSCSVNSKIRTNENVSVSMNSMLTKMPVFIDNSYFYFAENGKILKDMNSGEIIDECNESIISNIYVYDDQLYYTKQDSEKIDMVLVDTNNYTYKTVLFSIDNNSDVDFGDGFIYCDNEILYYFSGSNQKLYRYKEGVYEEILDNITAVTFDDNIYYADNSQTIYRTDKSFIEKEEIWNVDTIKSSTDNFMIDWCNRSYSEYSVIRDLSILDGQIIFRLCSDPALDRGLLIKIIDNGFSYCDFGSVKSYQYCNDKLIVYGAIYNKNGNKETWITDFYSNEMLNVDTKHNIYFYDKKLYFYSSSAHSINYDNLEELIIEE